MHTTQQNTECLRNSKGKEQLCRKTLVLSAEVGKKLKFALSTFIHKLLVFIQTYSTIHRSDEMKAIFHTSKF